MKCSKCGGEIVEIKGEWYCINCGEKVDSQVIYSKKTEGNKFKKSAKQNISEESENIKQKKPIFVEATLGKKEKSQREENKNLLQTPVAQSLNSVDSIYSNNQVNDSHPVLNEYDQFVQSEEKESRFRFEVKLALIIVGILIVSSLVLAYIFWWTPKLKVAWYFSSINENTNSLEDDLNRAKTLVDILKVDSLKDLEDINEQLQLSSYSFSEEKKSLNKPILTSSDVNKSINTSREGVDLCQKSLEKIDSIKKLDINNSNVEIKNTHSEILSRISQLETEFNELNSVFTFIYVDSNVGKEFTNIIQNVNIAETQSYSEFVFLMDTTSKRLIELTTQLNSVEVTDDLKKLKEDELQVINIFNDYISEINISVQNNDTSRLLNAANNFEGQLLAVLKIEYTDLVAFWEGFTYEKDISEGKAKVKQANELLEKIKANHYLDRYRVPLLWYGNEII